MAKKSDSKRRKEERKAKKEAEKAAKEAHEAAVAALRAKQKRNLVIVPVVTLAIAAGLKFGLGEDRMASIAVLLGGLVFLLLGLGALGSGIAPRDRLKAGSIDFGASGEAPPPKRRR